MTTPHKSQSSGLPLALGAYCIWGLLPLYLQTVKSVPPFEFVGWRVIFTLPVCLVIMLATGQTREVLAALARPRAVGLMLVSALLIGGNWLLYVSAIRSGHVFATSLGYYINPLVNVLAGTLFLGERLSRRQWLAVAVAAGGVSLLAWGAQEMLGVALGLAVSFAAYGLVRKLAPIGSLPGLTLESAALIGPAIGLVWWQAESTGSISLGRDPVADLFVAFSGIATAVPLLMFANAARRMDYSTLGFVQYLAPTLVFLQGLFVFDEPLRPVQLASFLVIWSAIGLYSWDMLQRRNRKRSGKPGQSGTA